MNWLLRSLVVDGLALYCIVQSYAVLHCNYRATVSYRTGPLTHSPTHPLYNATVLPYRATLKDCHTVLRVCEVMREWRSRGTKTKAALLPSPRLPAKRKGRGLGKDI